MDGPTVLGDWYAQGIPVPSTDVPTQITVTNSGDVPPTSVTAHIVDEVVDPVGGLRRRRDAHRGRDVERQG